MIRLGSLAGYPFEGPRLLAGWTPPASAAVYAIAYKPEPDARPDRYAVIYVGHSDDLSAERFPFQHPRAHCWIKRAGSRWKVYICTYEVPGGGRPHREQIARELTAIYQPRCNDQQFDQAWKDEWIGGPPRPPPAWPRIRRGRKDRPAKACTVDLGQGLARCAARGCRVRVIRPRRLPARPAPRSGCGDTPAHHPAGCGRWCPPARRGNGVDVPAMHPYLHE